GTGHVARSRRLRRLGPVPQLPGRARCLESLGGRIIAPNTSNTLDHLSSYWAEVQEGGSAAPLLRFNASPRTTGRQQGGCLQRTTLERTESSGILPLALQRHPLRCTRGGGGCKQRFRARYQGSAAGSWRAKRASRPPPARMAASCRRASV